MRNNKNKGFTLVELLVVIAILAILATVSVVGYTSYIKNAEISNDQNLAGQLNQFSAAINADHTSDFHNTAITPENVWAVTNEIRELGGLDEIVPSALKYGHLYFRFDKDKDGNYVGGEYVFVEDKDIKNSGLHFVLRAFGLVPNERPGFFEGNDGNLYFLIDTTGSNLAEAVRGFYTFDHIEGTNKFDTFQNIVSKLGAEHQNIKDAAQNSVFVTTEGTVAAGESATGYVFHTEDNLSMEESVTVTLSAPVVIPENVEYIGINAIDVVYNGEGNAVVFEKSAEELSNSVSEGFINVDFEVEGEQWTLTEGSGDNQGKKVITPTAADKTTEHPIGATNPLADFDILVNATKANSHYNSISVDAEDGTNVLNIPYVVWHNNGEITLSLDPNSLKAADPTKPLSSSRVTWALVGDYEGCVTLDGDKLTLSRKANGLFPNIDTIKVTATSVYAPENGTAKSITFDIKLSRGTDSTVTVDGNVATNNAASVLWGENADGYKNSYTIGATLNTWDANKKDGFVYDSDIKLVVDNTGKADAEKLTENNTNKTISTTTSILGDNTATKDITFKVIVGGYYEETVTITLNYAKVLFDKVNVGIDHIGTDGVDVTVAELFKQVGNVPEGATVAVNAYIVPQNGQGATIANLDANYKLPTTADDADGVYGTQTTTMAGSFDFNLAGTANDYVILVVTVDGVRASENYELTIVPGKNVNTYAGITDTIASGSTTNSVGSNIVLLGDVTMDTTTTFVKFDGKNLYGNCYTFNIENGRNANRIITLNNSIFQDVKVVGALYPVFSLRVGDEWGSPAIAATGTTTIENVYASNCRSPLRLDGGTVTVRDSVFFGGRYCNIDHTGGTLIIDGHVTTIQQPIEMEYNNKDITVIGIGISSWFNDQARYIKVNDNAKLYQYNFLDEETANILPAITYSNQTIVEMKEPFAAIFTQKNSDDTLKYGDFIFSDVEGVDENYVNSGIVSLDKYGVNIAPGTREGDVFYAKDHIITVTIKVSENESNVSFSFKYNATKFEIVSYPTTNANLSITGYIGNKGTLTYTDATLTKGSNITITLKVKRAYTVSTLGHDFDFYITSGDGKGLETLKLLKSDGTALTLTGYDTTTYDYEFPAIFETVVANVTDSFHTSGINYDHMEIDVTTMKSSDATGKTLLQQYVNVVSTNYFNGGYGANFQNGQLVTYQEYLDSLNQGN